jgi:hypothetical protein
MTITPSGLSTAATYMALPARPIPAPANNVVVSATPPAVAKNVPADAPKITPAPAATSGAASPPVTPIAHL